MCGNDDSLGSDAGRYIEQTGRPAVCGGAMLAERGGRDDSLV